MDETVTCLKDRLHACFGIPRESLDKFENTVRQECAKRDLKPRDTPIDFVQIALEDLYEWFDKAVTGSERPRFVSMLLHLVREVRIQESGKRPIVTVMHPIEPSPGQIEHSEQYQKLLEDRNFWRHQYCKLVEEEQ